MAYLDASPMISALKSDPVAFEFSDGYLHHIPSRHRFNFDVGRDVRVHADCGCSLLRITKDQQFALHDAFQEWRSSYWRPIEINREFASHFAPRSWLREQFVKLTVWLLRELLSERRTVATTSARLLAAE